MLDPVWAFRTLLPEERPLGHHHHAPSHVPGLTPTVSHTPLPTIVPGPDVTYQEATDRGVTALWVTFWVMLLFTAVFSLASLNVPLSSRPLLLTMRITTTVAALAYLAMACGYGSTDHLLVLVHQHKHNIPPLEHHVLRQIFWARHTEQLLTAPLITLILGMISGINGTSIVSVVFSAAIMAFARLVAAFGAEHSVSKWAWYAVSVVCFVKIITVFGIHGRRAAAARGGPALKYFDILGAVVLDIWTAYFVVWGIGEGSRVLSVNGEIYAYAILDFLEKPLFLSWLLYYLYRTPDFGVRLGGFWTDGFTGGEGTIRVGDEA